MSAEREAFLAAVLADAAATLERRPPRGGAGAPLAAAMRAADLAGRRALRAEAAPRLFADAPDPPAWLRDTLRAYTTAVGEVYARRVTRAVAGRVEKILADAARKDQDGATVRARVLTAMVGPREAAQADAAAPLAQADTAWNTMLAAAESAGRFRAAEELAARAPIALRFVAVHDDRVRPNHLACDGFTAHPSDPVWRFVAPPLGFNCRCKLVVQPVARVGPQRPPPGGGPDAGFDHDLPAGQLYGF